MRRSRTYLVLTALQLVVILALWTHGRQRVRAAEARSLPVQQRLVAALQLTDVALWTEARYTRHPTQADFFSPFQDLPSSLEHFPAGSVIGPGRDSALFHPAAPRDIEE